MVNIIIRNIQIKNILDQSARSASRPLESADCRKAEIIEIMTDNHLENLPFKTFCAKFFYSNSTITNQFCLKIVHCRISVSFDYLFYPYYPAYMI